MFANMVYHLKESLWLDHQERAGSGETVALTKVRKTSSKEKIKAQDSEIGTEIKNMHVKIVEVNQEMESRLTLNDKGVCDHEFCKKELKKYIQIFYTNADGLSNNIDKLNTRINETFPEIIEICETKLNDDIGNEAMPKNYTIIRKDRSRGRGDRVCIMVREDLNSKVCTDLNCVDTGNTEPLWCKISTKDGINMIVIGLI